MMRQQTKDFIEDIAAFIAFLLCVPSVYIIGLLLSGV